MDELSRKLAGKIIEIKGMRIDEDTIIDFFYSRSFSSLQDAELTPLQLIQQQDRPVN